MQGQVKWFNETKGFGFIRPDGSDKDVFVHVSTLQKARIGNLLEGQKVEFDKQPGKKGDEAVNLRLV